MRRLLLLFVPLSACAPELPPEQIAARRAQALMEGAGQRGATLLAPIAGIDDAGQVGVCGLIETRSGPVRVVVELASGTVRIGKPAAMGGQRADLGESRFCDDTAQARWANVKRADPVGLMAKFEA